MPRWIRIRKADIDLELRKTFERYGVGTMQNLLAREGRFRHGGNLTNVSMVENDLLAWLTDQYDRAERKEVWSLTMEVMIVIFVGIEILPSIIRFICRTV
jgi:hypothetical protein